uniref:Uncharacterized protein n=1 Tax=Anguilla anguilla TaxID=7936 RepID=A0A0E9TLE5_ANGAN
MQYSLKSLSWYFFASSFSHDISSSSSSRHRNRWFSFTASKSVLSLVAERLKSPIFPP